MVPKNLIQSYLSVGRRQKTKAPPGEDRQRLKVRRAWGCGRAVQFSVADANSASDLSVGDNPNCRSKPAHGADRDHGSAAKTLGKMARPVS